MTSNHSLNRKIELRRVITTSAFTMITLVAVIGIFSLFSIWSINRAWTAGTAETAELQSLSRTALDSQVDFKVQIQEWKNILIRGDQGDLLDKYLASFRSHAEKTQNNLANITSGSTRLGFMNFAEGATSLRGEHTALTTRYEAVLAEERGTSRTITPEMASLIDKTVRGADRKLEASIEELSQKIANIADERRLALFAKMQERYGSLRWFILSVIGLSLAITAYVLSSALRVTRS
jgi:hypothetical protein